MRLFRIAGWIVASALSSHADEGMWLFTNPPMRQVQEKYGFEITQEWLDHLQKASVRFGNGGSGSFVSAEGLILTNHHVGAGMVEKLSTAERDLLKEGFVAGSLEAELRCPDLELNVLVSVEDVTERVNAVITPDQTSEEAAAARRAVIAEIEKASQDQTGLRSDVVTLFQGGEYHLYRYHRYTDVRLVMAPDARAAAFGGDADNFEYPRYCLDFTFFRAYEDGKPAKTPHFLHWNAEGAEDGELVFTSGHPGRTNRATTLAQLEDFRDHGFPYRLEQIFRNETVLQAWAARDVENARRAERSIVGTQNGRKATVARLDGLLDADFMQRKAAVEAKLREIADEAFEAIVEAEKSTEEIAVRLRMLEGGDGFGSGLFWIARDLLRAGDEAEKPDGERLAEYQESGRVSFELGLFSDEPVYKDFETVKMANALTFMCAKLSATDPLVVKVLAGKSPQERAAELIRGTQVDDVAVRRALYEGGKKAVAESEDPMILVAKWVDAESRVLRTKAEAAAERISQAHAKIAAVRFQMEGDSTYPDATFSLRLSVGVVKGYMEDGAAVPFETTYAGMAARNKSQGSVVPFDLSDEWKKRSEALDDSVPLNFVSTNDITGGNSGSPVVNRKGELVGLIFDSNSHGLVSDFAYTEERGRAVSVHSEGILEALRKIYRADRVLAELGQDEK